MSITNKRQRQLYFFTGLVATVAIINLMFFLILYRPARNEYSRLLESIGRLRAERLLRQRQVELKEKMGSQLETSSKDREMLLTKHFIPLSVGYAQILPELDTIAQRTGVRKTTASYSIADEALYGLYLVKIVYPVQGGYSNVVNFIKQLEDSRTFYIITQIDVRSGGDNAFQTTSGNLTLGLNLETFIYQ